MPITPKNLINTVADQGRKVVSGATGLFRRNSNSSESTSPVAPTPASAPRAGGTKTGTPAAGTTRSQRAKASGTSARKPATASKAKTAAAKSQSSAAKTPGSARPKAGTSRSTAKPAGDGASVTSLAAKDTAPTAEQKSS
jgi:hypothetical protein